jgi:hypothetical protein
MVVPDLGLICEIMLMAEGFQVGFSLDTQLLWCDIQGVARQDQE